MKHTERKQTDGKLQSQTALFFEAPTRRAANNQLTPKYKVNRKGKQREEKVVHSTDGALAFAKSVGARFERIPQQ